MALKQRARKDEDKQARRDSILQVAAALLASNQFSEITMAQVARECGLAKGTVYLYFKSKEELFLAALERELSAWFDELGSGLIGTRELTPDRFGAVVARSLARRDTLADLLTILHTVLERNIDTATAVAFKEVLRDRATAGGRIVEAVLPGLPQGSGARLMVRLHALVVGLRQMADPAPTVAEVLGRQEFADLRVDFETDLADTLSDLVRGMCR